VWYFLSGDTFIEKLERMIQFSTLRVVSSRSSWYFGGIKNKKMLSAFKITSNEIKEKREFLYKTSF